MVKTTAARRDVGIQRAVDLIEDEGQGCIFERALTHLAVLGRQEVAQHCFWDAAGLEVCDQALGCMLHRRIGPVIADAIAVQNATFSPN